MILKNLKKKLKQGTAAIAYKMGLASYLSAKSGILIVMFHKINDAEDFLPLTLSPRLFEALLEELSEYGEIISIDSLAGYTSEGTQQERLKIILTFDDGYLDNYTNAFPILKKYNLPATIYLSTDHVDGKRVFWYEKVIHAITATEVDWLDLKELGLGQYILRSESDRRNVLSFLDSYLKSYTDEKRNADADALLEISGTVKSFTPSKMLTWNAIQEMAENGISFGSHTISHPILSRETTSRIRYELNVSKEIIESHLGGRISSFAYPNGTINDFNEIVLEQVKQAGYKTACTTISGINSIPISPFQLKRINVSNATLMNSDGSFNRNNFWFGIITS